MRFKYCRLTMLPPATNRGLIISWRKNGDIGHERPPPLAHKRKYLRCFLLFRCAAPNPFFASQKGSNLAIQYKTW